MNVENDRRRRDSPWREMTEERKLNKSIGSDRGYGSNREELIRQRKE